MTNDLVICHVGRDVPREAVRASDLSSLESDAIGLGHECMAEALGIALEALDARLFAQRPGGLRAHGVRPRTLATEIGDVSFSIRRYGLAILSWTVS